MGSNFKSLEKQFKGLKQVDLKLFFYSTAIESRPLFYKLNYNFFENYTWTKCIFLPTTWTSGLQSHSEPVGYGLTLNKCCEPGAYAIRAPR